MVAVVCDGTKENMNPAKEEMTKVTNRGMQGVLRLKVSNLRGSLQLPSIRLSFIQILAHRFKTLARASLFFLWNSAIVL